MGRTNSSMASPAITPSYGNHSNVSVGISAVTPISNLYNTPGTGTNERSRNRSKISRLSHSQRKNYNMIYHLNVKDGVNYY